MALVAHAAVDVSDGLACDVGHLADASGVCVVLDESALLVRRRPRRGGRARSAPTRSISRSTAARTTRSSSRAPSPSTASAASERSRQVMASRYAARAGERPIEPRGFDHFTSGKPTGASGS